MRPLPTKEQLDEVLRYEPETGKLFWRERGLHLFRDGKRSAKSEHKRWNARYAGREAFFAKARAGYLVGDVFAVKLLSHRVIWCIQTGSWPVDQIDHINGQVNDNRWDNLREVSPSENAMNRKRGTRNTSGVVGVGWAKRQKRWQAWARVKGALHHLGYFKDFEEAVGARKRAEAAFNFHENHGRAA